MMKVSRQSFLRHLGLAGSWQTGIERVIKSHVRGGHTAAMLKNASLGGFRVHVRAPLNNDAHPYSACFGLKIRHLAR
jgi:hypothetical protein